MIIIIIMTKNKHLKLARRPDLLLINKKLKIQKNLPSCRFCDSGEPQNENERKRKKEQILGSC